MAIATSTYFAAQAIKKVIDRPAEQAKRGRQRSAQQHAEAREKAKTEQAGIADKARKDRQKRLADYARSETLITDPLGLGGKADTVRKILTGQ